MTAGDALPILRHLVEAAAIRPVAGLLQDPNPIHLDPGATAAAGLGDRVINQGPANLAYILNLLSDAFPLHRVETLNSRFLANVRAGDVVEAGGTVIARQGERIECDLWLRVVDVGPAVSAKATLVPR